MEYIKVKVIHENHNALKNNSVIEKFIFIAEIYVCITFGHGNFWRQIDIFERKPGLRRTSKPNKTIHQSL